MTPPSSPARRSLLLGLGLVGAVAVLSGIGYWFLCLYPYSVSPREFLRQSNSIRIGMTAEEVSEQVRVHDGVQTGPVSGNHPHSGQLRTRYLLLASPKSFLALDYAIEVYFGPEGTVVSVGIADL